MWTCRVGRQLVTIAVVVLLGGLLSATLVRLAPGFDVDEQQLNAQLSAESQQALRAAHGGDRKILAFYRDYWWRALHGDLGKSRTFERPVRQLLGERLPVTLRVAGTGLVMGWVLALVFALAATATRVAACDAAATVLGGSLLSIPAAVLALFFVYWDAPASLAIALVVFPKVFSYARNLLMKSYAAPHILTARAKGLGPVRILLWHVLPVSGKQLLAVAGISVSIALGAAIPVEALCSIPGIGQLAWQAALGRDLPLLVNLTVLVTVTTLIANLGSQLAGHRVGREEA